jgi:hypothetical protein
VLTPGNAEAVAVVAGLCGCRSLLARAMRLAGEKRKVDEGSGQSTRRGSKGLGRASRTGSMNGNGTESPHS